MKKNLNKGKLFLLPCLLADDTHSKVLPVENAKVIKELTYFFVENIRSARRFISSLKLGIDIEQLQFFVLDKDSSVADLRTGFDLIESGISIGVLSEAGCPGIADPGSLAVDLAHKTEIEVVPMVGPSSILLALMASGFSGQSFEFHGYLPIEKVERIKALKMLEKESIQKNKTQIFIETPYRNMVLIQDVVENLHPNTLFCIASDITAENQFIKTQNVINWKKNIPELNKKPTVFLIWASK